MRFSRTYRAVLVFLFVGFLGASGPALDGSGSAAVSAPRFEVWLDYPSETFSVEASDGEPGAPGVFNFLVASGPATGLLQVPFTFDATGDCQMTFPLSVLNNGWDMLVGIQLLSLAGDGSVLESGVWALQTQNYLAGGATLPPGNLPSTPGGWVEWITWPGAPSGPLYPHCSVAINSEEPRSSGQPMLALESGPAGSFPIN